LTCTQQPCLVDTTPTVSVPGTSSVYRLRTFRKSLRKGVRTKITVIFPARVRTAIRRALAKRRVVTVRLKIVTRPSGGPTKTMYRTIRIRPAKR
jgi:hypothetical protein